MPKRRIVTNTEFELGHSRVHDILSKRDEVSLAKWFILFLVVVVVGIVAGTLSGLYL